MYYASDVARRGTSDQKRAEYRIVDRMCLGPSIGIIARALIPRIITATIEATWRHQTHRSHGARTTDHDQEHVSN